MTRNPLHLLLSLCLLVACAADQAPAPQVTPAGTVTEQPPPSAASAAPERPSFCARPGEDAIRDAFCGDAPPAISSLHDLQVMFGLITETAKLDGSSNAPQGYNASPKYPILMGHSTALSGFLVSPINPRAIVLGRQTVMAFQRGAQLVELVTGARDRTKGPDGQPLAVDLLGGAYRTRNELEVNFYLLRFRRACDDLPQGCTPGEMFTPSIESNWTGVAIDDAEDLKNTPSDCRQCHQRGRDQPLMLMRELESPWTHFFEQVPTIDVGTPLPGVRGYDLMRDYHEAHGNEAYGGIDVVAYPGAAALVLQTILQTTEDQAQPLLFDSGAIEDERWPYGPDGYATEPQPSPTWERGYEAFKRGEQLALPYLEPRATDLEKQTQLSYAYARQRAGETHESELPDLGDVFPDDPSLRARIGLQTEPAATPAEALIQACGTCHNDVLDQSISRARFNIDLSKLDGAELAVAVERIERPRSMAGAMPPPGTRQLDPAARERLLDYLRGQATTADTVDPQLTKAAQLGMCGATCL